MMVTFWIIAIGLLLTVAPTLFYFVCVISSQAARRRGEE